LQGVVSDQTGAAIGHAQVTIRNARTGTVLTTTTDALGSYRFNNVQPGSWTLAFSYPGFNTYELSNFSMRAGRVNNANATLRVGATTQNVEVQAGN
jgi:hypothetical protein